MAGRGQIRGGGEGMDKARRTRWMMRAASLVFAVILWFFVTWDGTSFISKDLRVPLRFQDMADGYSVSSEVKTIDVRLEGSFESLALINGDSITASVGLQDLRQGKYRLPVQISALPANIRVTGTNPNAVDFELFRMIERTMRPSLTLLDEIPQNMSMGGVTVTPQEISVKGPEADVLAVRRAEVKSGVRDLMDGEHELAVYLESDGRDTSGLVIDPPSVMVRAEFTQSMREAAVPIKVSITGEPREGFGVGSVTVSPDTATLRGAREWLEAISELEINAIDVTDHTESMNVDIPLESPNPNVTVVGPNYVNVRVELRTAVEIKTFAGVNISVYGASGAKKWSVLPPSASVTVERSLTASAPFDVSSPPLELYVDVTNIVAPQIVLPVLVRNAARGMSVIRIEPQQVTVSAMTP
jgi:YbbR domain-containing protein